MVEDQDELRTVICAMISELGFEVTQASNADVAHALLAADGRFELLLTDVNMPGSLDGAQLATLARQIYPTMTIIVATGRVEQAVQRLPTELPILRKPFRLKELAAVIGNSRRRPDEQSSDVVA